MTDRSTWLARRKRISEIIEVGNDQDWPSRLYDVLNALAIVLNLTASILYTFAQVRARWGGALLTLEHVTVAFFAVDYCLRLWTARCLYPKLSEPRAVSAYALSFSGLVDLFSFLPYFLPIFFPAGAVAFRMFRVVRIFRLFRINAYYDSLNVITQVVASKRQQLLSSVFIILVLMLASSLCMYSLEHEAQPEVFSNAFSGIWWSVSTRSPWATGTSTPSPPWASCSASSSPSWGWAWWPSPPASFPPASWTSTPGSSGSAGTPMRPISASFRWSCPRPTPGPAGPSGRWTCPRAYWWLPSSGAAGPWSLGRIRNCAPATLWCWAPSPWTMIWSSKLI